MLISESLYIEEVFSIAVDDADINSQQALEAADSNSSLKTFSILNPRRSEIRDSLIFIWCDAFYFISEVCYIMRCSCVPVIHAIHVHVLCDHVLKFQLSSDKAELCLILFETLNLKYAFSCNAGITTALFPSSIACYEPLNCFMHWNNNSPLLLWITFRCMFNTHKSEGKEGN